MCQNNKGLLLTEIDKVLCHFRVFSPFFKLIVRKLRLCPWFSWLEPITKALFLLSAVFWQKDLHLVSRFYDYGGRPAMGYGPLKGALWSINTRHVAMAFQQCGRINKQKKETPPVDSAKEPIVKEKKEEEIERLFFLKRHLIRSCVLGLLVDIKGV